jgi:alcohol dehydrogenase
MKAAIFAKLGEGPELGELPDPGAAAGDAVVDVVAAPVLPYANEVFSGQRPMLFELPFVPGTGAIGRICELGEGAGELKVGDWVYCDPTVRARDSQGLPAIYLQGLTAGSPEALSILRQYRNGSWAEKLRLPVECVVPLGDIDPDGAPTWLTAATMMVPFGGLDSVGMKAGETVVVNGATGSFGNAAVAVALAMGAARVIAVGRSSDALAALEDHHGARVRSVQSHGGGEADTTAIRTAAERPIDVVLDILPPQADPALAMAAIAAVRPGGRVSLMGGVGRAGVANLELSYAWIMRNYITIRGQWLYPRGAMIRLLALARAGALGLERYRITEFPLAEIEVAIAHAASDAGPFNRTVVRP